MSITTTQIAPPLPCPTKRFTAFMPCTVCTAAGEGWVFLGCLFQDEWETFCRTVQRGELPADRRFSTPEARQANDEALVTEISAILAERTAAEWEELLVKAEIGCVRADEALEGEFYADHPHAKANDLSVEVEHPYVGKYLRYGGLVELSLTPGVYRTSIQIGQHTKPLLREIGYDDQEIEDLGTRGIVQWADPSVGGEP